MLGNEVAERIGPVWGFDDDGGELRNMWTRTAPARPVVHRRPPGAVPDVFRYLALQIKALEDGLLR